MSERVIARVGYNPNMQMSSLQQAERGSVSPLVYYPDPEAPSVSEVVEVLRDAKHCLEGPDWIHRDECSRIDNLIARLEGA